MERLEVETYFRERAMQRSVRTLFGILAGAAVIGVGIPMASTAASATSATTALASSSLRDSPNPTYYYYSYSSTNNLATASGTYSYIPGSRYGVRVGVNLYDLDSRTYKEGGECAYVRFDIHHAGDEAFRYHDSIRHKFCGYGHADSFHFSRHNTDGIRITVCQIGRRSYHPDYCSAPYDLLVHKEIVS
jgi:hypothetical protein